jgi:hypothetical protein
MVLPGRIEGKARTLAVLACRVFGLCVFVAAFFLPACRVPTTFWGYEVMKGWECAELSLICPFVLFGNPPAGYAFINGGVTGYINMLLATASGWVNLFVALILIFSISRKSLDSRKLLTIFSLAGMAATWIFLHWQGFGHSWGTTFGSPARYSFCCPIS